MRLIFFWDFGSISLVELVNHHRCVVCTNHELKSWIFEQPLGNRTAGICAYHFVLFKTKSNHYCVESKRIYIYPRENQVLTFVLFYTFSVCSRACKEGYVSSKFGLRSRARALGNLTWTNLLIIKQKLLTLFIFLSLALFDQNVNDYGITVGSREACLV